MNDLAAARDRGRLRASRIRHGETFRCGHPRSEDNTYTEERQIRCLTCKRERAAQYQRSQSTPRVRIVPLYKTPPCLLAECWK